MRLFHKALITFIAILTCWLNCTDQAQGQLSQALNDYKFARPLQYAPTDPWTRSKLFHRHTKHSGFFYNCDGEECKRNSPYICWKPHSENDLPTRTRWWQRLSKTADEVKRRIADGACIECAEADPCQRCQQRKCGGCCDCGAQPSHVTTLAQEHSLGPIQQVAKQTNVEQPVANQFRARKSLLDDIRAAATSVTHPSLDVPTNEENIVRTAGLESLDTRVK